MSAIPGLPMKSRRRGRWRVCEECQTGFEEKHYYKSRTCGHRCAGKLRARERKESGANELLVFMRRTRKRVIAAPARITAAEALRQMRAVDRAGVRMLRRWADAFEADLRRSVPA